MMILTRCISSSFIGVESNGRDRFVQDTQPNATSLHGQEIGMIKCSKLLSVKVRTA